MSGEKTEKATPKKLKDLRKKGTVARSIELPQAVVMVVCVAMLPSTLHRLSDSIKVSMIAALSNPPSDAGVATAIAKEMLLGAAKALAPLFVAITLATLIAATGLARSAPNPMVLKPRKDRVSAKSGIKRMLSAQILFDLARSVVKLTLLAALTWGVWKSGYAALTSGTGSVDALISVVGHSIGQLLVRATLLAMLVGIIDAWWSRRRFNKQAKMSKQDVIEESKATEGNPHSKAQIRSRQAKLSRLRMFAAVAGADVVLANPTHLVVALKYTAGDGAPMVVAKGAGAAAERIKAEAALHGVPVVPNKVLARALYRATEVGDAVPIELYHAVAEILATVYSTRKVSA